jgi:hypothetical protein
VTSGLISLLVSVTSPAPTPMELNAENVNPGPLSGIFFTALAVSLLILVFSMNRHIKRVNFNEDNDNSK